jgi:hypothetical protein
MTNDDEQLKFVRSVKWKEAGKGKLDSGLALVFYGQNGKVKNML